MAYEQGTYLQELEEEHKEGRHHQKNDLNCPSCRKAEEEEDAREAGFDSVDEYHAWMSDEAIKPNPDVDNAIDDVSIEIHQSGGHRKYPTPYCRLCVDQHGLTNLM